MQRNGLKIVIKIWLKWDLKEQFQNLKQKLQYLKFFKLMEGLWSLGGKLNKDVQIGKSILPLSGFFQPSTHKRTDSGVESYGLTVKLILFNDLQGGKPSITHSKA